MFSEFLSPVDNDVLQFAANLNSYALGRTMLINSAENPIDSPDDLENISIIIIGVNEFRNSFEEVTELPDLNALRKEFYKLFPGNWYAKLADLGDIVPGATVEDTYYALKELVSLLVKNKIVPVLLGGSQDLTYAAYRAYDVLEQPVNLVCVDPEFDLVFSDDVLHSNSYLNYIIQDQPSNLNNFANVGYQSYYTSQEGLDLMDKLFFECYRLGEVVNDVTLIEPVMRDADIVSIDAESIQGVYLGNEGYGRPNGFTSREICSVSRYAGISDKVSCFGIFNILPHQKCYALMAQVVWYFAEGFNYRYNEYPFSTKEDYIKYIVPLEDNYLYFYKSNKSDRWWIKIPVFYKNDNNNLIKEALIPCAGKDYEDACAQIMPERWWRAYKKSVN